MTDSEPVIKRNVSMYPQDWLTVQEVSGRYRLNNLSAALRFIVNEYARLVNEPTNQPPTPQED